MPQALLQPSQIVEIDAEDVELVWTDEEIMEKIREVMGNDLSLEGKDIKDWSLEDSLLKFMGRVWVPDTEDIKQEILHTYHNSKLAGYGG